MEINTFLASLPEDWSAYFAESTVRAYLAAFGADAARSRLVSYIGQFKAQAQNPNSQAAKKMYTPTVDPRTVYYNKKPAQTVSKPVLGKGKKLTGNYIVMEDDGPGSW